jgi:molecular chaperone DnaK
LGGDDFDQRLVDYLADEFKKQEGTDLRKDPMALQRLKVEAERAKCELSTRLEVDVKLPYITAVDNVPKHLDIIITRAKFEQLVDDLIQRTIGPCKKAMQDAGYTPSNINEVILVGGSTRIPKVQEVVKQLFDREPHKGVNPDEVVAIGAAIQGGVLAGDVKDVLLLDVTPLSLGIETLGGVMTKMIDANTTIPTKKTETYSTAADNQSQVEIHILQGERPMAQDNRTLGRFILDGIPPAPRGIPQIEVTFDIDANGILHVAAKDKASGKEQSIKITHSSGLTDAEIEKMKRDAKEHESDDKKKKEEVHTKNEADQLVFQSEKNLKEFEGKISSEAKMKLENAINRLKEAQKGTNIDEIKSAIEAVNAAWSEASTQMYSQATGSQGQQQGPTGQEETPKDGANAEADGKKVENADYEVLDDDKKK